MQSYFCSQKDIFRRELVWHAPNLEPNFAQLYVHSYFLFYFFHYYSVIIIIINLSIWISTGIATKILPLARDSVSVVTSDANPDYGKGGNLAAKLL